MLSDWFHTQAPLLLAAAFSLCLLLSFGLRQWLALRQIRHVARHAAEVPAQFAGRVSAEAHRKAAGYTIARVQLGMLDRVIGAALLLGFTLLGGIGALHGWLLGLMGAGLWQQLALVGAVLAISSLTDLPLAWYRQFRLEARFGFNRMTLGLWLADMVKGTLVGLVLGGPLLAALLWLMDAAGERWWLWAWALWSGFNLLLLVIFPTVIAPLFNKFEPLNDEALRSRIEALMARCGFASKGLFVMDGSRRSSHGNAYFTGFGKARRIVFFDTLIERLAPVEIEAVLAHELGHFKLKHVTRRMLASFAISLGVFALLGWLAGKVWFYVGLGVTPMLDSSNAALALLLFFLAMPVFGFAFGPVASWLSRRDEFAADAFAARQSDANALVSALVKLYEDNASTLTPDPLYSAWHDSHPPAPLRIARLGQLAGQGA
ncbi:M48 family metallopeptidase [Derxia gummosa]|uniref:M48 family metallopeptidase n=1 Tax=Derxia gummosa DSM 723 TaxID=1121388 RepID=A0A8B6X925_9BURK|nr:M48 family metallopeptidase [Derxia gummosa]